MYAIKSIRLTGLFFLFVFLFLSFAYAYLTDSGGATGSAGPCAECATNCAVEQVMAGATNYDWSAMYCLQKCGCGIDGGGTSTGGTGITDEPKDCPAAPDGHPQARDATGACYDIYFWEDYCGRAAGCNACQNSSAYSCIWNGAGCVPCKGGNCSYGCYDGGGNIPGGGGTTDGGPVNGGDDTGQTPPISTVDCSPYSQSCEECTNSGEAECAWSTIFNDCISYNNKELFNAAGFKARIVSESLDCPVPSTISVDCSSYSDCFTCTGEAGVKRECQWTNSENKCIDFNPEGNFDYEGNDVWLPLLCQTGDCSIYSDCGSCTNNAACAWSAAGSCVAYKEAYQEDLLYPDQCVPSTGTDDTDTGTGDTDTGTGTTAFSMCPNGCVCDNQDEILECGGKSYVDAGLVPIQEAVEKAEADGAMMYSTTLKEESGKTIYEFHGFRKGKLLGLFDFDYDLKTFVDAETGTIEKTEEPWWSFLVFS